MLKRVCALTLVIALLLLPVSAIDGERIARRGPGGTGKLALTFDDGPHPKYTEQILAILKEYDCKATFFVIGENVRAHPELLKAEFEAGHEIGNHTDTHAMLNTVTLAKACLEVNRCANAIEEVIGVRPRVFRPPGGAYSDQKIRAITEMGYRCVLWSQDSRDWTCPSVETTIQNAKKDLSGGAILLFHDFNGACSPTPDALRTLIPELKAQGYEFVTVSELFGDG